MLAIPISCIVHFELQFLAFENHFISFFAYTCKNVYNVYYVWNSDLTRYDMDILVFCHIIGHTESDGVTTNTILHIVAEDIRR